MFGKAKDLIDVIEWTDYHQDTIVQRKPESGPGDFKFGAQLIVRDSQAAVFFRDGKALDTFGPGRHTLSTANLPLVEGLVKAVAGGHNVFTAEVFFVNQRVFTEMKWGTPNPIDMKDPDLGWVQLRAFGSYSIKIEDPQLFIGTLVGQQRLYTTSALSQFLKGSLRTHLNSLLGSTFESYAKIRGELKNLAEAMKVKVRNDFAKYGIELRDFFIDDVSVPEEVQEAFRMRAKMGVMSDQMATYLQYQQGQAMVEMAKNPGAGAGAMQMGAGMGMGMAMGHQMAYPGYPPPPSRLRLPAAGLSTARLPASGPGSSDGDCGLPAVQSRRPARLSLLLQLRFPDPAPGRAQSRLGGRACIIDLEWHWPSACCWVRPPRPRGFSPLSRAQSSR